MDIDIIRELCRNKKLRWTNHIFVRLVQRGISMDDVTEVLLNGEIIEDYPDDYPYPSCLVFGIVSAKTPLHVVCGSNGEELWLITAYIPNTDIWKDDFKTRKEK